MPSPFSSSEGWTGAEGAGGSRERRDSELEGPGMQPHTCPPAQRLSACRGLLVWGPAMGTGME